MHRREFLTALAACPLCAAASAARADARQLHGKGAIAGAVAAPGAGVEANTFDLADRLAEGLDLVSTHWPSLGGMTLRNNGEALVVEVPEGGRSFVQGREFKLLEFHFHHTSGHRLGERSFPLELHFVHQAPEGDWMVLGVLLEAGAPHPLLNALLEAAPRETGEARVGQSLAIQDLLPEQGRFYSYTGRSIPPSDGEVVTWVVYDRPFSASRAQIDAFAELFPRALLA